MKFYPLYVALAAVSLASCTRFPPPGPVPPDSSDAAPWSPGDAAPPDACASACAAMSTWCGPQRANCAIEMRQIDMGSPTPVRRPDNGHALKCTDVVAATSLAAMRAIGACP